MSMYTMKIWHIKINEEAVKCETKNEEKMNVPRSPLDLSEDSYILITINTGFCERCSKKYEQIY